MAGGKLISTGVEFPDATTQTTSGLPLTGGTMTGHTLHGDNILAKFGASDDLVIYHDGSNSRIKDAGTGNLYLSADADILITNSSGNEHKIKATSDGSVILYYDNASKLSTSPTGIDVTGSVTCDGFTSTGIDDNATSTAITIDSSEHVSLAHGIGFNGDTAAANALDDYEEGTWTPTLTFNGSSTGITYEAGWQTGWYIKVGGLVTVSCHLIISSKGSATGGAQINGLPFSTPDTAWKMTASHFNAGNITYTGQTQAYLPRNQTKITLRQMTESGTKTNITDSNIAGNSDFGIAVTFTTDS